MKAMEMELALTWKVDVAYLSGNALLQKPSDPIKSLDFNIGGKVRRLVLVRTS